jgi:hypothetical protein
MSIKLTTPFVVAIGGSQVENDTDGACTSILTDFLSRVQTSTFQVGTIVGSPPNLNPGPQGQLQNQSYILIVHMDTGAWSDNHGHSGIIPANILTGIENTAVGDRNNAESFMAVPGGLMPGTITLWTSV